MKKFQVVFKAKYVLSVMTQVIESESIPDDKQVKQILNDIIMKNNVRVESDYLKITKIVSVIEVA